MEGAEHGDGIGELAADGVRVTLERLQGGVLDAGGGLPALLDQPAGGDGARAAGVASAMDAREVEVEVEALDAITREGKNAAVLWGGGAVGVAAVSAVSGGCRLTVSTPPPRPPAGH